MRKFDIPKPCSEKWENMTPQGSDRFCDVCQKTVYNFEKKREDEIEKLLAQNPKICAKISSSLNFSKVLLLSVSLNFLSCTTTNSTSSRVENVKNQFLEIKGKILSGYSKNGLDNAEVKLYTLDKVYSTFTNVDGEFILKIPKKNSKNGFYLSVLHTDKTKNFKSLWRTKQDEFFIDAKDLGGFSTYRYIDNTRVGGIAIKKEYFPIYIVNGKKVSKKEFDEIRKQRNGAYQKLESEDSKKAVIGSSNFDDAYLYYTPEAIVIQESN